MKQKHPHWLKNGLVRVTKVQLILVIAYVAQIIAFDSAKLITPEAVLQRWLAVGGLTIITVGIWYVARGKATNLHHYKLLTWALIISNIAFAAFNVYTQRGMASRAVVLFFIPIIISAILLSRSALFATATFCAVAYTSTAVAYFVNYFNEGYKIELYGEILFYSSLFYIAAFLLWATLKTKRNS